jgi:transcriptional regulator with XRE-family HTH domain
MTEPSHSTKKRRAGAEDVEIGRKIRALRLERRLSQSGLADGIDLTFQQVQKYEKGTNRVSAGRLQRIADMLNTPVMFFYGGMGARPKKKDQRNTGLAFSRPRAQCGCCGPIRKSARERRSTRWWCWRSPCATRIGRRRRSRAMDAIVSEICLPVLFRPERPQLRSETGPFDRRP